MPNKFSELALLHSPWHAFLPAAMGLSTLMEAEMNRALAIAGLTAREFAALLEIRRVPFPGEGHTSDGNAPTQRVLAARLGLTKGGTSELLGRLEKRGLIRRPAARTAALGKRGRPRAALALTSEGKVALTAAAQLAMNVYEDWARRLAKEAAGTSMHWARANGLKRWLTESLAALKA